MWIQPYRTNRTIEGRTALMIYGIVLMLAGILLFLIASAVPAHAQSYELAPYAKLQFFDDDGAPLSGGQLRTCTAGSSCDCSAGTPLATYSDTAGTPNTNPVVLDSAGRATVYLGASSYKLALCTSADVAVWTQDNVQAVGLASMANFNHTLNVLPKFGGSSTLTTSQITDDGTKVTVGAANAIPDSLIVAKNGTTIFGISQATADVNSSSLSFYKSRGSHASPGDVQNGDQVASINTSTYSNNAFFSGTFINTVVDGAFVSGQAPPTRLLFGTNIANASPIIQMSIFGTGLTTFTRSINVGAPTGGDKGVGTINIQGDIYKNNTAYANPDFVFERYYTGKIVKFAGNLGAGNYHGLLPLKDVEKYAKRYYQLPGVGSTRGMFERSDIILQTVEELYLHLFELQHEIDSLKSELAKVK